MTPIQGLRTGFSLCEAFGFAYDYRVNPPFGPGALRSENDVIQTQYSLEYQLKSWTFQAEYKSQNVISQNTMGGNIIGRSRTRGDAWYLGAAYRFNKWLEAGSYYSESYSNVDNRSGDGTAVPSDAFQKDLAVSLRFDPKPWWVIKLELHGISGTGLLYDHLSNPARNDAVWYMLAAKTTFSF
jgi:predicted porin